MRNWEPGQETDYVVEELAEQARRDELLSYDELNERAARFASRYEDANTRRSR